MYERNAIVLERFFDQMFGYDKKSNVKTNFKDYCELVSCLEKYKNISDEEDEIMQEYDSIANRIREIQKSQELLKKRNNKYQAEREELFENIDENSDILQKKFDIVNNNILSIDEQIKDNANDFIEVIAEFNEKSNTRAECAKSRRDIESDYNRNLNKALDDYKEIDINLEKTAKNFIDVETEEIEEQLKNKIKKNGEKEKIPFNNEVIEKAITLSIDVQKRETEILANVYEKTNKLFNEIKNNSTKIEKHKKIIKDSKCKLEFVGALKEYLVQFLDNERLTAVNGVEEHEKLMSEACKNIDEDLIQINNLYTLLQKESSKKITKKSYPDLYNVNYLSKLEKKSEEFDEQVKRLNLPVTIINPDYWRIEGMKKIYDIFYKSVTEEYGRDLSEYLQDEEEYEEEENWDIEKKDIKEENSEPEEENEEKKKSVKSTRKVKDISKKETNSIKSEIDKKIDMILGVDGNQTEDDDDWDDDDEEIEEDEENAKDEIEENDEVEETEETEETDDTEDNEEIDEEENEKETKNDSKQDEEDEDDDDEVYYDIWGNGIKDNYNKKIQFIEEDDDDDFDFGDFSDDEYEDEYDEDEDEDDWDNDEEEDEEDEEDDGKWDDEWDDVDWDEEEEKSKKKTKKSSKDKKEDDDWGDEFVNIEKKEKVKKKGFFNKFKK